MRRIHQLYSAWPQSVSVMRAVTLITLKRAANLTQYIERLLPRHVADCFLLHSVRLCDICCVYTVHSQGAWPEILFG